jgi:hypothetical protein
MNQTPSSAADGSSTHTAREIGRTSTDDLAQRVALRGVPGCAAASSCDTQQMPPPHERFVVRGEIEVWCDPVGSIPCWAQSVLTGAGHRSEQVRDLQMGGYVSAKGVKLLMTPVLLSQAVSQTVAAPAL